MLAIEQTQFMAEVEIARVEAAPRGGVGVHAGIPFPALQRALSRWVSVRCRLRGRNENAS
jgi:hypothetical protein